MKFTVKCPTTGELFSEHGDADFHPITSEPWARNLLAGDICCFAITQDCGLVLLDECWNYAVPPPGRFEVSWIADEPAPGEDPTAP